MGLTEAAATNRDIWAHLYWLCRIFTHLECSALREASIPCYFEDLQHMVPHRLCSKPAYWLIWVIPEENVTNLCRKCCNWIFFNQDYMALLSEIHVEAAAVFLKQPCSPAAHSNYVSPKLRRDQHVCLRPHGLHLSTWWNTCANYVI